MDQVSQSSGGCAGLVPAGRELGLPDFWWLVVPGAALFVLLVPALRRRPVAATGVVTLALVAGAVGVARSAIVSVEFFWVHTDHLGTPLAVTDTPADPATADVVWRASYEVFGDATVDEDPDGDQVTVSLNVRFPGQYYDGESGLHYNFYRTYDPGTGRYLEADPIGMAGGVNLFAYALNNPIARTDPFGDQGGPALPLPPLNSVPPSPFTIKQNAMTAAGNLPNTYSEKEKDAYRHCLASCEVASFYTQSFASAAGTANEWQRSIRGGQTKGDVLMDHINNAIGRLLARSRCLDCSDSCRDALDKGLLFTATWNQGASYQRGGLTSR